jgi:hypothetical protein
MRGFYLCPRNRGRKRRGPPPVSRPLAAPAASASSPAASPATPQPLRDACPKAATSLTIKAPQVLHPAFVIRLTHRTRRVIEYLARADTAVAELSPQLADAWQFPTREAAVRALQAALGSNMTAFRFQIVSLQRANE